MPTLEVQGNVFRECDQWVVVAHGYDIAAQGETIGQAIVNFRHQVLGQIDLNLRQGLGPLDSCRITVCTVTAEWDANAALDSPSMTG